MEMRWIFEAPGLGGKNMRMSRLISTSGFFLVTVLSLSAWSQSQNAHPARPGSINYVEGQASIGAEMLGPNSVGSVELREHQLLTTQVGKVEILLTPGVFMRVADHSSVRILFADSSGITVQLDKGRAIVEVLTLHRFSTFSVARVVVPAQAENELGINQRQASTDLLQNGLYDFDADHNQVRVLGPALASDYYANFPIFKADVYAASQDVRLTVEQELTLNTSGKLKAHNISAKSYVDDFYRWCSSRSGYLSEATFDVARDYVRYGSGWYGSGWYWNPWYGVYTFVPAEGILYRPFGWDFNSPIVVYRSPFFYYGYYHYPHHFGDFHGPYGHGVIPD